MDDHERLRHYARLADGLLQVSTKEQLVVCLRLMALHVAHFETLHGPVPRERLIAMLHAQETDPEVVSMAASGLEILAGALALVQSGLGDRSDGETTH